MPDLAVVVPTLGRPQTLAPLVELFAKTTQAKHRIAFVARADDEPTWDALVGLGPNVIGVECDGSYPAAVNAGIRATDEPVILVGADDIRPHPGWFDAATAYLSVRIGFVSLNDQGNPDVMAGEYATLPLVARWYVDSLDGPLYFEGYRHGGCDLDASLEAKARGVFAYAPAAVVEHMHPDYDKAEVDTTYAQGGMSPRARCHDHELLAERWGR